MKRKFVNIFLLLLVLQLIVACCGEKTYEVTITGMESRALILDENNFIEFDQQNPIDKEDLIIEVLITEFEEIVLNEYDKKNELHTKVFKASAVPFCNDDQVLIFNNRIERVKVEVLDATTNSASIDITNQVVIQGTEQSISEYIAENNPGIRDLLLQLSDTSNIPDSIEYIVEATLDDGAKISTTGGIINFN